MSQLIKRLDEIKSSFGGSFPNEKFSLLSEISAKKILSPLLLRIYHESLCYLRAYADNASVLELVESELRNFHTRVQSFPKKDKKRTEKVFDETGIAGTKLRHEYSYEMTRWLVEHYPESLELDWKTYQKADPDPILTIMPHLVCWSENDAVDDPVLATKSIIDADIGKRKVSRLRWFLNLFERLPADPALRRHLYDNFSLPLLIRIANSPFARTNIKIPLTKYYYQTEPLKKEYPDLPKTCKSKEIKPRLISLEAAKSIFDIFKQAMIMRHRELYPLTFANPHEVYSVDVGRGTIVYVIGMIPEMRLPLESNYSALLVRNGVPIGYGIGAMVCERIEIAINIFETFRRGEAGFIFGKFTQIFHQLFGSTYLLIRKYQVGYDNDEGLKSGAYWFYYRLGFRSLDSDIRALADVEAEKISSDRSYRTPQSILRRLAKSDMCLDLTNPQNHQDRDLKLGEIALRQTRFIGELFNGDRNVAEKKAPSLAKKILGLNSKAGWSQTEWLWFDRMSLLVCALPEIADWGKRDKQDLVAIIKAKGALQERDFVKRVLRHQRFRQLLSSITN